MKQTTLLKLGEIIVDAYTTGKINQATQEEMITYVNDFLLLDMIKSEEAERIRNILADEQKAEMNKLGKREV